MNPNQCRVVLRPRGPLEVFDLTLQLVRARWSPLLKLVAIVVLPVWAALVPLCWLTDGHPLLLAVPILLSPLLQAPFTVVGGRLLFADEVAIRQVFTDLAGRLAGLAWSIGAQATAWLVAALSCGVALAIAQPALLFLPETALLERVGMSRGVNRSTRLAGGQAGAAMVGALAWWGLTAWFGAVGEASGQALVGWVLQLGTPVGAALDGQVTPWLLGGMLLAQPVHAIYRLLLYVDVRTRVEGWDLQVGLRAAGLAR